MPQTLDSLGRVRSSNARAVFESKLDFDDQPFIWDDLQESGGSTTSTHSIATSSTLLRVSPNTAGKRTRQTFMRFSFIPGQAIVVKMTGTLAVAGGGPGITSAFGYYDDENGVFLQYRNETIELVYRTSTSGEAVDVVIPSSEWNVNKMDTFGLLNRLLDPTKTQIFIIDFEWIGVGIIRAGFVIDGQIMYVHEFKFANVIDGAAFSTPNLPLRYQIENDGTGPIATLRQVCASIIAESQPDDIGLVRCISTEGTELFADTAGVVYAVLGIRLKSTHLNCIVTPLSVSMIATTSGVSGDFEWFLAHNPTVAGTFEYSDMDDSCLQIAKGVTANIVTGGLVSGGGWAKGIVPSDKVVPSSIRIGSSISGVPDELVLCVRALTMNTDIQAALVIKETN